MRLSLIKNFLIIVILAYVVLRFLSPSIANFALALLLVGLIPYFICRLIFMNTFYKNSINMVNKRYVGGENTLKNGHCTIVFAPDKTITVMENMTVIGRTKRIFTLTKSQMNVNKAWYRICRIFDEYTAIDMLKEFFDSEANIVMMSLEVKPQHHEVQEEYNAKTNTDGFVEMGTINPDVFGADFGKQNKSGEGFVSMDKLHEVAPEQKRVDKEPELAGLDDLMNKSSNKIDVNKAEAGELALLPGINIVTAKKIVEYRNLNGNFKNMDDFLKVCEAKEHFFPKIKEKILVQQPKSEPEVSGYKYEDNGRIIDF